MASLGSRHQDRFLGFRFGWMGGGVERLTPPLEPIKKHHSKLTMTTNLRIYLTRLAPLPSLERRTVTIWNYIKKDQGLFPSGLLGPVKSISTVKSKEQR